MMPRKEGARWASCCATVCQAETEISPLTNPASFLATAEKKRERCLATMPLGSRGGSEETILKVREERDNRYFITPVLGKVTKKCVFSL